MERFRRDVFGSRTASMVARLLGLLGIEPERWAIRHAYARAPIRRLAVARASRLTWCDSGSPRRVLKSMRPRDIYAVPPALCMKGKRKDA